MSYLDINKDKSIYFFCHTKNRVNLVMWHSQPVLIALAGIQLRCYCNIMKGGNHLGRGICFIPGGNLLLQFLEHLWSGKFAKNTHLFRVKIAVIGDDSFVRKYSAFQGIFSFYRPKTG